MKKKILIAVVGIVCLLSMVLAGCSNIKIENVDTDVINVMQDAINNSQVNYSTYYIRERYNTDPKNVAKNEMTEVMLNMQADDKSIEGVDNTKINFSIKYTKGITEYTDSFIIGQSLSKNIKAKSAKAEDYKLYVFENYKKSKTAPVFTRTCEEILAEDVINYVTETGYALNDYTMASILAPLKELTQDDIKMAGKGNVKQGKVTTYVFEVVKEGHKYHGMGQMKLMLYTDKKVTRVMSFSSEDEKYTLDVMYQGPKIDIPNYDNYSESDNQITLTSDRSDGLVALYTKDDTDTNIAFEVAVNPVELDEYKLEVGEGDDKITYTYKITTVESAVNWDYEYTEIVIRLFGVDKDGNEVEYDGSGYEAMHYFVQTKNIVKTKKDFSSMIPLAAAAVAIIALIIALIALFKIKKQNKELTKQIKAISGETEEEVIIDAEVETTEEVAETNIDDAENAEVNETPVTTEE